MWLRYTFWNCQPLTKHSLSYFDVVLIFGIVFTKTVVAPMTNQGLGKLALMVVSAH
jgi:hypothetical protein